MKHHFSFTAAFLSRCFTTIAELCFFFVWCIVSRLCFCIFFFQNEMKQVYTFKVHLLPALHYHFHQWVALSAVVLHFDDGNSAPP